MLDDDDDDDDEAFAALDCECRMCVHPTRIAAAVSGITTPPNATMWRRANATSAATTLGEMATTQPAHAQRTVSIGNMSKTTLIEDNNDRGDKQTLEKRGQPGQGGVGGANGSQYLRTDLGEQANGRRRRWQW